jgi:23S rRNA G2069 N7-methylase RlmK/C1962 C5-methylase RlmI
MPFPRCPNCGCRDRPVITNPKDPAAEIAALRAENERKNAALFGARELVTKAADALRDASSAITRESWQDGPTITQASKHLRDCAENIKGFGIDGYPKRIEVLQNYAAKLLRERDAATAALRTLGEALREVERHHAARNDAVGRPQERSKTLAIVRTALSDPAVQRAMGGGA